MHMTAYSCFAILGFAIGTAYAQPAVSPEREWPGIKFTMERDLPYTQASDRNLTLDLYRPSVTGKLVPLIVWIHGQGGPFGGKYPTPIASIVGNEYAVASIEYRTLEDCQSAVRWLRSNAATYGLDPNHFAAWGYGQGGRIAASLDTLQAAVNFAGPAAQAKAPLLTIPGAGHDFKQLRQESLDRVNNFLDDRLKDGTHVRHWLGKIDPPADAWVDPIVDEPVGTRYVTFPAPVLGAGREASYLIYLPPGYETSGRRYPVIYYLHGGGGSQRVGDIWVQKLDAAIQSGAVPAAIAVLVEGLPGGRFLDSPDGKNPIESVIMKNLLPHIDSTYRTIPRREARALEGLSMGGYGSFHLGFKYPEMFGMISGLCNGLAVPQASAADRGENPFVLAEQNLAAIRGRMPMRIIVGTEDFTLPVNEAFHAQLTKLGIPHEYKILPGVSHGYKEYYERLDFSFFKNLASQ